MEPVVIKSSNFLKIYFSLSSLFIYQSQRYTKFLVHHMQISKNSHTKCPMFCTGPLYHNTHCSQDLTTFWIIIWSIKDTETANISFEPAPSAEFRYYKTNHRCMIDKKSIIDQIDRFDQSIPYHTSFRVIKLWDNVGRGLRRTYINFEQN